MLFSITVGSIDCWNLLQGRKYRAEESRSTFTTCVALRIYLRSASKDLRNGQQTLELGREVQNETNRFGLTNLKGMFPMQL